MTGYTLTRTFDAPRDLVWQCWTQPEHFAVWFGGHDGVMKDMVVDATPGGAWGGTMIVPGGHEIAWTGKFLEVEPTTRLVLAFNDQPELGEEYDTFTVTLADNGDQTDVVLVQAGGHLTPEQYEQAKAGTAGFLDVLAELLADLRA